MINSNYLNILEISIDFSNLLIVIKIWIHRRKSLRFNYALLYLKRRNPILPYSWFNL